MQEVWRPCVNWNKECEKIKPNQPALALVQKCEAILRYTWWDRWSNYSFLWITWYHAYMLRWANHWMSTKLSVVSRESLFNVAKCVFFKRTCHHWCGPSFFFSNLILEIKKKKDYGSECIMNDGSSFVGFISDKRPALPNGQVGLFLHLACKAITNSAGRLG